MQEKFKLGHGNYLNKYLLEEEKKIKEKIININKKEIIEEDLNQLIKNIKEEKKIILKDFDMYIEEKKDIIKEIPYIKNILVVTTEFEGDLEILKYQASTYNNNKVFDVYLKEKTICFEIEYKENTESLLESKIIEYINIIKNIVKNTQKDLFEYNKKSLKLIEEEINARKNNLLNLEKKCDSLKEKIADFKN